LIVAVIYFASGAMAITGHMLTHVPQFIHFAGSIAYLPFAGAIAITGHIPAQLPHAMHFAESIL
jgi:hypothetical protein